MLKSRYCNEQSYGDDLGYGYGDGNGYNNGCGHGYGNGDGYGDSDGDRINPSTHSSTHPHIPTGTSIRTTPTYPQTRNRTHHPALLHLHTPIACATKRLQEGRESSPAR